MGINKKLYVQDDEKWGHCLWYDEAIDKAFARVTRKLHSYAENPRKGQALLDAKQNLSDKIDTLVSTNAYRQTVSQAGSLAQSGCWHTSISNMLTLFNVNLGGQPPTPLNLLETLKNHMLGTLTGYVKSPFVDPLSIITEGRVQLSRYRDFGIKGLDLDDDEIHRLLLNCNGVDQIAIVNVNGHEFFGGDSHYVLIKGVADCDYDFHDPGGDDEQRRFKECFKTIYQISLYEKFDVAYSAQYRMI